jgi:hypothetical protein
VKEQRRTSIAEIGDERECASPLRQSSLAMPGGGFANLLAVLAPHGKWERAQSMLGDLLATLAAVAVRSVLQSGERFVDP